MWMYQYNGIFWGVEFCRWASLSILQFWGYMLSHHWYACACSMYMYMFISWVNFLSVKNISLENYPLYYTLYIHGCTIVLLCLYRGKRLLHISKCYHWGPFSLMTLAVTSFRVRWSSLWYARSLMAGARRQSPLQDSSYTSQRWMGKQVF